jgi:glucuronoarabinoxylan endo-1,4-beta-xylanase
MNKNAARRIAPCAFGTALLLAFYTDAATVSVNWNSTRQEIDGFGAAFYDGSYGTNVSMAGYFFDRDTGIGLSVIRMRVDNVIGSAPIPAEIASMQLAFAHNPNITLIAAPWSPPAAWKTNNNVNNGGELMPSHYQDYANLLADWVTKLTTLGYNLHALSIQNEPDITQTYPSCRWNNQQYLAFDRDYLKPTFTARSLITKIMVGDACAWDEKWAVPLLNDPVGVNAVDIASGHPYCGEPTPIFTTARAKGKKVWQTEFCKFNNTNDPTIVDGLYWAENMHHFLVDNLVNAYLYWNFARRSDSEGLMQSDGTRNRRLWTFGNFSKFIRPGYVRIDATPANAGNVRVSAYRDPATGNFAVVAINSNGSAASTTFNLDFAATSVIPNLTTQTVDLKAQAAIPVTNGSFTTSLPAQSVTTFTGVYDPNTVFGPQITPASGYLISSTQITITCGTSGAQIYYTTDGANPSQSSTSYTGPFTMASPGTVKAIAYKSGLQQSPVTTATYLPLRTPENPVGATQGLDYSYYQGTWTTMPNFTALTPVKTGTVTNFDISGANLIDYFGFRFTGYVDVPKDTIYTFSLNSNDGSMLYIGNTVVVNNDGVHGTGNEPSGTIGLKAGKHAIRVDYFEAAGEQSLLVKMNGVAIPAGALFQGGAVNIGAFRRQPVAIAGTSDVVLYNLHGCKVGESARAGIRDLKSSGILVAVPAKNSVGRNMVSLFVK